jgi:hypothetical protein
MGKTSEALRGSCVRILYVSERVLELLMVLRLLIDCLIEGDDLLTGFVW